MVVNEDGVMVTETQPATQEGESSIVAETEPVATNPIASIKPMNAEHEAVIAYANKLRNAVFVPQPSEDNFCARVKQFIETRGDAMASSAQLLEAYDLFQNHCVEKQKEGEGGEDTETDAAARDTKTEGNPTPAIDAVDGLDAAAAAVPPIIKEYVDRDSKLTTFDDDLGVRPDGGRKIRKITESAERENNKNPYLFFLVILGIATVVYAINKKN